MYISSVQKIVKVFKHLHLETMFFMPKLYNCKTVYCHLPRSRRILNKKLMTTSAFLCDSLSP